MKNNVFKKKKNSKQTPLDAHSSTPHTPLIHPPGQTNPPSFNNPGYPGSTQYGQYPPQNLSYYDPNYHQQYAPQSPGFSNQNQKYYSDNSGHQHRTTHSRNQSQEYSPHSSSYSF